MAKALRCPSDVCLAMLPSRTGEVGNIFYERYGTNEDALVLFVHGGVGGLYTYVTGKLHQRQRGYYGSAESQVPMYKAFIKKIMSGNRCSVLAYDRRGCGNSRARVGDESVWYGIDDLCDDIICLLRHHEWTSKRIHVIGTSAGGPVAMHFALRNPVQVKSLVLLNTTADLSKASKDIGYFKDQVYSKIRESPSAENQFYIDKNIDTRIRSSLLKKIVDGDPDYIPEGEGLDHKDVMAMIKQISVENMRDVVWKSQNRNISVYFGDSAISEWKLVNIPTIIVHGSLDTVIPYSAGIELYNIFKSNLVSFHTIEGFGHGVAESAECQRLVCKFLDEVGGMEKRIVDNNSKL